MNKIILEIDVLKAALEIAPKRDVRTFLNGINLRSEGKMLYLNASDGNIVFRYTLDHHLDNWVGPEINLNIPRDVIERAIAGRKAAVILGYSAGKGWEDWRLGNESFSADSIAYPNIDRVVTSFENVRAIEHAYLDLKMLGKIQRSASHLCKIQTARFSFGDEQGTSIIKLANAPEVTYVLTSQKEF